uniref:ATP synthase complex subunit 8 n=2 Tax=Varuna TaxID=106818 RepID=A0A343U9Q5_9EUCA|nr:ATP synthase F0 subunit 8 [Varuna yui]YP_010137761.1 ATP synthase F0 subunit 8 [Varuna litterata]AUR43969.1 ATP synthase F0 subunit 8 [Varuna litterata]AVA07554.1 ATP synthase F0 subunit 8 [Varuna yui]
MPQMAPIYWLFMFGFFLLSLFLFFMFNYFLKPMFKNNFLSNNKKFLTMKSWKL